MKIILPLVIVASLEVVWTIWCPRRRTRWNGNRIIWRF
jgi:hypothetical protein